MTYRAIAVASLLAITSPALASPDVHQCAVQAADAPRAPVESSPRGGGPVCPGCVIELHLVLDNEFLTINGVNAPNVALEIIGRVDEIFSAPQSEGGLDLRLHIAGGTQFAGPNPWAPSSNSAVLLSNFRGYVFTSLPMPAPERDMVVLFTGVNLDGGVLGLSYLNSLCSESSIALVSQPQPSLDVSAALLAHVIGHMMGAVHDAPGCPDSGFIMSAGINPNDPPMSFSQCSIDDINAFIDENGDCLDAPACNVADMAEPFGSLDFSDVVAFLGAFGAMDALADIAPPFGVFNFSDVVEFLTAFGAGCP